MSDLIPPNSLPVDNIPLGPYYIGATRRFLSPPGVWLINRATYTDPMALDTVCVCATLDLAQRELGVAAEAIMNEENQGHWRLFRNTDYTGQVPLDVIRMWWSATEDGAERRLAYVLFVRGPVGMVHE